ncbi:MAG: WhiB family transcriptional regulator, partial [Streptomyces sp.]|nr:WhiB family transcriptional regulator [Streptomyces sp.]
MTTLAALAASTAGLPCRTTDPELWFSRTSADRTRAVALC